MAWLSFLIAGLFATGVHYLAPLPDIARLATYLLLSGGAAVAVWWGVLRNRPRPLVPWALVAVSQAVYAVADATFYTSHYVFGARDFPGVADLLYLAHYPLLVAGLVLLIRRRAPGRDLPELLDTAVLAVTAALLSWVYLIQPLARFDAPVLVKAVSVAYPAADLAMLVVAFRLMMGSGRRPASFFLLIASLLAIFAADSLYMLQLLKGTYEPGNYLDVIWLTGNLTLAAAALHPTMTQLSERSVDRAYHFGPARIAVLLAAGLLAPTLRLVQHARGEDIGVEATAVASAVLVSLIIARMAGMVANQRHLAITDGLTGLRTRGYLEDQLGREVARAERTGAPVAMLIFDVDHFKSVNDRYGHPAGDNALVEIADRLRDVLRPSDVMARYGGEEFAVLAPGADPDQVSGIADRVRCRVSSSPVTVAEGVSVAITVSIGAASYPAHASHLDGLVAVADRALYQAKAGGRDRVVIGETSRPSPGVVTATECPDVSLSFLCRVADEVDTLLSADEHSRAISRWMATLAIERGEDQATVRRLEIAGRLHDIGKIMVPKAILTKTGALTPEESLTLRQHPEQGARLANLVPDWHEIAQIVAQHHERHGGGGYPRGIAGAEIQVGARMVAVCDAWAAMRASRPYQPAMGEQEARAELLRCRGTQFDPEIADVFLSLQARGMVGELGNDRRGSRRDGQPPPSAEAAVGDGASADALTASPAPAGGARRGPSGRLGDG